MNPFGQDPSRGGGPRPEQPESSQPTELDLDALRTQLRDYRPLLLAPPQKPNPTKIASNLEDRPLQPDGVNDTDNQIMLRSAFNDEARSVSLAQVLEQIADGMTAGAVWNHLKGNNRKHMMIIIDTMYGGMVQALIDGNIAHKYATDRDFRRAIDIHHALKKIPGNYVQQVGRTEHIVDLQIPATGGTQRDSRVDNPHAGRWLTAREIVQFHAAGLEYIRNPQLAQEVDGHYQGFVVPPLDHYSPHMGSNPKNPTEQIMLPRTRRYLRTSASEKKLIEFLDAIYETYVSRAEKLIAYEQETGDANPLLDIPFTWGPSEIGYGVDLQQRADAHSDHNSSNYLFTFFQALLVHLFDREKTKFKVYRFMVNQLPRPYENDDDNLPLQDANTTDVGITLMAGAHWFNGGLNPDLGAGGGVHDPRLKKNNQWLEQACKGLYARDSIVETNLAKNERAEEQLAEDEQARDEEFKNHQQIIDQRKALLEQNDRILEKIKLLEAARSLEEDRAGRDDFVARYGLGPVRESSVGLPTPSMGPPRVPPRDSRRAARPDDDPQEESSTRRRPSRG
ncbi:hypothetical protein LTR47_000020 [Exophiala xenobiotica]|nr:hypothetical protein LTR41_003800 [Exophiala xenobiotica]KAK5228652.1 hypothetical protein LTR72_002536 [Exophiala xenobiotica]KAK5238277.1 hypothetical protein LTR47_000020 [Exophiala xenobiotica]KAK5242433.1 hypothetical protein LTS06_011524 [Exophiala xenobiotica]KAK5259844.1 hypothetical protein LTR40_005227 [Exophiala xenobiotica]